MSEETNKIQQVDTVISDVAINSSDTEGVSLVEMAFEYCADEGMNELKGHLQNQNPAELAELLESLPVDERITIAESIDPDDMPRVLAELNPASREIIAESIGVEGLVKSVNVLPEPYAAELLQSLPEGVAEQIRESLDPHARGRLDAILEWGEGSAGRLMHVDAVSIRADITLAAVQRYLRMRKSVPFNSDLLMVVDREGNYLGNLSYGAILTQQPDLLVESVMDATATSVEATTSEDEVVRLFERRDLLSVAVVNGEGTLIGRISVDDVMDLIRNKAGQQMMHMANLHENDDTFGPVWPSTRKRGVWLGINLLTAFLASWVIGLFQDALDKIVALAVLMPIVTSMGGITGSQTLALVIRGLSLGTLTSANARKLALKELSVATLNGLFWALMVAIVTVFWFQDYLLGGIIAFAMIINMAVAALSGWGLPIILNKLGQDPAISGSVLLTTITDVIGFMAFLGLATLVFL